MQVHNNRDIFVVAILRYFISWYIPQPLYTVDPNDKYAYNGAAEALSSIVHTFHPPADELLHTILRLYV